jgi:hypothetical protein
MQLRWSAIMPIIGLILFAAVTWRSMPLNRHEQDAPRKYYWWSSLRLDSDPLNKNPAPAKPCPDGKENCADWTPSRIWVQPRWLDKLLVFSALPAFLAGAAVIAGLSKLGIDEVLTFMVSMPVLIFCWYYFLGWLIDRWIYQRRHAKALRFKVT